jgi:ubiquinone/menaquinone biosynthesis C-methylase UbiE
MASQSVAIESTNPQAEDEWIRQSCGFYACPVCKQGLEPVHDGLSCRVCVRTYPILSGIPDFIVVNLEESSNFSLHLVGKRDSGALLNFAASVYETCVYPVVCNLYGGWRCTSLKQLAHDVSDIIGSEDGLILDVACGPGTYGRRIASESRTVLGIDICMSMLRQGARFVERGRIPNVHFARAMVEALPFRAGLFDAAICAGSLNHFSDTVLVLREIGRTMKAGAPLAVMCFAAGSKGLFKYRSLRDRTEKRGGHIFELPDLDRYVTEAGFEDFRPHAYGSILVFSARKGSAEHIRRAV